MARCWEVLRLRRVKSVWSRSFRCSLLTFSQFFSAVHRLWKAERKGYVVWRPGPIDNVTDKVSALEEREIFAVYPTKSEISFTPLHSC